MNEYLKEYIELQKQFRETKGNPDSVRALYTFKEKLELSEDKQAKEVLVDVYDLLDFKKDAYELLCQIGNRSDKKTLKRLGTLKEYAENWGNHYALPKPKTPQEKQKEKERQAQLGGITPPLWKQAFLRSPRMALPATAAARRPIFSIQAPFTLWRILSVCARSVSPAARRPGNMTAASRTIAPWTMAWRIQPSWTSSSTELPATPVGSRNTGAPTAATTAPIWAMWVPENCGRWVCWRMCWTIPCGTMSRGK